MEANKNVPRPFTLLMQAIAYLLGGMFLFDASIRFCVGAGDIIYCKLGILGTKLLEAFWGKLITTVPVRVTQRRC